MTIGHGSNISEQALICLLKNRDRKGMDLLYDAYSQAIYGVILRIVKHESIAEEAMQDCFLKIWSKIDSYDTEKGRLFTWIINIARNLAIDKLKTRESNLLQKSTSIEKYGDKTESDSFNIEVIGMEETLKVLTREERNLIDLVYFEGYSHREIAKQFNVPLGTVKTRIRNAISKLRIVFEVEC